MLQGILTKKTGVPAPARAPAISVLFACALAAHTVTLAAADLGSLRELLDAGVEVFSFTFG